jgi:hypothetical protein
MIQHDTPYRSGGGCSLFQHDTLGRRVLAVQRRRSRAKGARCPAATRSGEGCSLSSNDALGRRLDIPVGPERGRKKKARAGGVECFYDDPLSGGCSLFQHDTPDRSGEPCSLFQHDTLGRRVLAVRRRRARAKGARCPATTQLREACSLSGNDVVGRRLDLPAGPSAGAEKRRKGPQGRVPLR